MQAHALRGRKRGEEQYGQKLLLVVAADIRLQRRKGGHRRINRERLAKRGTGQRHYGRRAAGVMGQFAVTTGSNHRDRYRGAHLPQRISVAAYI